jgi:hypothetical protein
MKTLRVPPARRFRGFTGIPALRTAALVRSAGILFCAAVMSCGRPSPELAGARNTEDLQPDQDSVALVGGSTVSREMFLRAWNRRGRATATEADKSAVLEDLVRRELLFVEAQSMAFEERPHIRAAWHEFIINRFAEELESQRAQTPSPAPSEIRSYYEAHLDQFSSPERVRAALILRKTSPLAGAAGRESLATELAAVREQALQQAGSLPGFGDLARHSDHRVSRSGGGDLGWMTRDAAARVWPEPVVGALFSLRQRGEVSPVISTPEGFFLLKLVERQDAQPLPLEEVRDRIHRHLWRIRVQEAEEAHYADLRLRHSVRVDTNLMARLGESPRQVASRPPPLPAN